ncbi:MAG TPA: SPOCS domain-containing protein [Caproicibacter sp.]|nr:SPOCS domain-containing protein [Caproicibacter sp.]
MDYMLERERIAVGEVIFDGCHEQPVDMDINLPDYCPDIQRILKCQIYPKLTSRSITGDRLMLDGSYTVKIFYLDPDGASIRYCESGDSYSAEIPLKQPADNAQILAYPRVEYINCRATSPRRLDVHGSFSLCAKVVSVGQNEVVSNIAGDDIEQQKEAVSVNQLAGFAQQQFSIDEVLELGQGKLPADNIVRSDAFAVLQDFKVTAGKLMVKGEVNVKFLYTSTGENNAMETMEYSIPFSQMLDCDGVTDDCMCSVQLRIASVDTQIKNDYSGDKTYFDTQVKIFASAQAYRKSDVTVVNDAYSKKFDLSIGAKQKTMDNLAEIAKDTFVHKSEISMDDNTVGKVIDVWSEMANSAANVEDGKVMFSGKYSLCVLALNESNSPFYFERLIDFEYALPCTSTGDLKCDADITVGGISYRITGSGIETKVELRLSAEISQRFNFKAISDVTADETKPLPRDDAASLCLYFADAGESLWNIAREYRTSIAAVRSENGLSGDFVENRGMLLIPM